MMKVWLDTDIGSDVDDAVALLCAIRHPEIRLIGVSTVMHRVEVNTWLAREMLTRGGIGDIPVLPGAAAAMGGDVAAEDASAWMPSHTLLAPRLPRLWAKDDEERLDKIADAMLSVGEPYDLLTVGPLTNTGRLLAERPELHQQWLSVTCMAGWLESGAEYNVKADVEAARLVLAQTAPRMVGLEASSYTLTRQEAEAALDPGDPVSAFLLDCYREYRAHADWLEDKGSAPMTLFDAITLVSLVRPDLFSFQDVKVLVESDGSMRLTDDGSQVTYATSCDWDAVRGLLTGLLRAGAEG